MPPRQGGGRVVELDAAHRHEIVLAEVGGEDALAEAEPALVARVLPVGLAREADRAVARSPRSPG